MRLWPLLVLALCSNGAWALELSAQTDWAGRVELGTPLLSAVVSEVRVHEGQRVSKGDPLVLLDDRLQKARLAEAEAALEEAKHDRDESRRELERAMDLYERTVLSQHELQVAETGAARGEATYRRAATALTQAQLEVEHTRIQAPFDALVLKVDAQPGQSLVNGLRSQPLVTLAAQGRMRVRAWATAAELSRIRLGDAVQVLADGAPVGARVVGLGLEPTEQSVGGEPRYAVEAELELPGGERLPAGLPVTLTIGD